MKIHTFFLESFGSCDVDVDFNIFSIMSIQLIQHHVIQSLGRLAVKGPLKCPKVSASVCYIMQGGLPFDRYTWGEITSV